MKFYLEDVAKEIKALDRDDPDWEKYVACIVKKHTHAEKLCVYISVFRELSFGSLRPRAFKKRVKWIVKEWLKHKVTTHEEMANRPIRKQIYKLFDWK